MADRRDVHPHHLLRALLDDRLVRQVLAELGVEADRVRLTLDQRWLAASDTIEVEEVETLGIDLATVLAVVNPPFDDPPDWAGRRLTDATRELLVRALGVRRVDSGRGVTSGHLLVAVLSTKEPIVAGTVREHGLSERAARRVVDAWSRRA
ncbi:Clp protease N-terminal domain-containing protein [Nocardioides sp. C4-1]|uniref:Clp protease N-terminal domain-containing protein n=1 Tax=Nocardioides sp. C4-1 TaxID=3151851 RepID=UPI0032673D32